MQNQSTDTLPSMHTQKKNDVAFPNIVYVLDVEF